MSTELSTGSSPADTERPTLIQRLPTPAFVVGYGAVVVALVVMAVMLANYAGQATTRLAPTEPEKLVAWNPAPADEDNVRASIRSHLITDVETATGRSGVMMRATTTEAAENNLEEFTGHVSRLLEQNCLDTLVLTTPDNLRVSFFGFCFNTLPPESIEAPLTFALKGDADSVTFMDYHSHAGIQVETVWADPVTESRAEQLIRMGRATQLPEWVQRFTFSVYTDTEVFMLAKERDTRPFTSRSPLLRASTSATTSE